MDIYGFLSIEFHHLKISSIPICITLYFSCLLTLAKNISTVLNKSEDSGYPWFLIQRYCFQFFSIQHNIDYRWVCAFLIIWRYKPCTPSFLRDLIMKSWFFSNAFSHLLRQLCYSCLCFCLSAVLHLLIYWCWSILEILEYILYYLLTVLFNFISKCFI
jgi:hypothetical protein